MCKLEQLLHILHKSSKRSESKTKINALTHFAYLNIHYKFCVKHYSQCTIFGVEIIKHFALFFQENYAGDNKNYATAGPTGRAKYQLWVTSFCNKIPQGVTETFGNSFLLNPNLYLLKLALFH